MTIILFLILLVLLFGANFVLESAGELLSCFGNIIFVALLFIAYYMLSGWFIHNWIAILITSSIAILAYLTYKMHRRNYGFRRSLQRLRILHRNPLDIDEQLAAFDAETASIKKDAAHNLLLRAHADLVKRLRRRSARLETMGVSIETEELSIRLRRVGQPIPDVDVETRGIEQFVVTTRPPPGCPASLATKMTTSACHWSPASAASSAFNHASLVNGVIERMKAEQIKIL
jgi:hypothetical protein